MAPIAIITYQNVNQKYMNGKPPINGSILLAQLKTGHSTIIKHMRIHSSITKPFNVLGSKCVFPCTEKIYIIIFKLY
jgi:hypothetical protein